MEQLPIIEPPPSPRRISRDEMNLAEFPLTVLSTRPLTGIKTLEFSDSVRGRNGELINRQWIITGADKFGLPTASDDEVLLGLLKLTVNSGFLDPKIYFSRYELLRILRWSTEGRSYSRLQKALDRLSGVRIKATNAFYDNESKAHSTRNFGIIDAYEINDGREEGAKPSFFIWSEVLFKSYQAGFIKKFDLDFYLTLRSAVSKRLYRYLDKHFWYRAKIQINLFVLAHEKLGVSRNYQYASSLKQQLDPALEELTAAGFISKADYFGKGKETEVIIYAGLGRGRSQATERQMPSDRMPSNDRGGSPEVVLADQETVAVSSSQLSPQRLLQRQGAELAIRKSSPTVGSHGVSLEDEAASFDESSDADIVELEARVRESLVARGLKEWQATRFVGGKSGQLLQRMERIVEYYDSLCQSGSYLVSRSPVGFLYRAIENPENFILPDERKQSAQATFPFTKKEITHPPSSRPGQDKQAQLQAQRIEAEYLIFRKKEIRKLRESAEASLVQSVQREVENALHKLRGSLSEARFAEMIEVGVEEKLAKLFAVPALDEWIREHKGRSSVR